MREKSLGKKKKVPQRILALPIKAKKSVAKNKSQ
jgi:hypothetical protein